MYLRALSIAALLVVSPVVASAQKAPAKAAQKAPVKDTEKTAAIRKLLVLTGAGQLGIQVMGQLMGSFKQAMPKVPERFWADFMKEVSPDELTNLIVPIYDKHLSLAEVNEVIRFYESPVGKKLVSVLPQVTQESMEAGKVWGAQIAQRVQQRLQEQNIQPK